MPLVFTGNEVNVSGHRYDDRTGVSYQFPKRYLKIAAEGERFVYYSGRATIEGRRRPQVYFGIGIVGAVTAEPGGELYDCEILDYRPFAQPVYFKDEEGQHFEAGGARGGLFFQVGVRRIADSVYEEIVKRGFSSPPTGAETTDESQMAYASPAESADVDAFAVATAERLLNELFRGGTVRRAPHNNPGFDLLVEHGDGSVAYVEVKGTRSQQPHFFLTEGERRFSVENSPRYTLIVVYGIDVANNTCYGTFVHRGPINDRHFRLRPRQWAALPTAPTLPRRNPSEQLPEPRERTPGDD